MSTFLQHFSFLPSIPSPGEDITDYKILVPHARPHLCGFILTEFYLMEGHFLNTCRILLQPLGVVQTAVSMEGRWKFHCLGAGRNGGRHMCVWHARSLRTNFLRHILMGSRDLSVLLLLTRADGNAFPTPVQMPHRGNSFPNLIHCQA